MVARLALVCLTIFALDGCRAPADSALPVRVAAASNLSECLGPMVQRFEATAGVRVQLSFGSTAQLAQQIEYGAPFDVFVSADTQHVDSLIEKHRIVKDSRAVYALGQLALWLPKGDNHESLAELVNPKIRYVAIAQPELAPYGKAAMEALQAAGIWSRVSSKLVYATSVGGAREMAETGNADAALTAYSLVLHKPGRVAIIGSHEPIEQALGITSTGDRLSVRRFRDFILSSEGQAILRSNGYETTSYRP